jgi:hypothetical protein
MRRFCIDEKTDRVIQMVIENCGKYYSNSTVQGDGRSMCETDLTAQTDGWTDTRQAAIQPRQTSEPRIHWANAA